MGNPNRYIVWESGDIYTNYGAAEVWMLYKIYEKTGKFDHDMGFPGLYKASNYLDIPVDIAKLECPPSKVVSIKYRQNKGAESRETLFSPIHIFCLTTGRLVKAIDLKPGDVIVSVNAEFHITSVEVYDHQESNWYVLTTSGDSPNLFVNMMLSYPIDLADIEKFEYSLLEKKVDAMETEGYSSVLEGTNSPVYGFQAPELAEA